MAPQPGSYQGTVAELFATLGLDTASFDEGLKKSEIKLAASAQGMKGQILSLYSLMKQLETQVGPKAALETFDQLNRRLGQSTTQLFKFQKEVMGALLEAQHLNQTIGGTGGAGGGGVAATAAPDGGSGGNLGIVASLTRRFLIYQGLRLAVQGITSAFHEADDITRRMDQTGWGSKGVQQLQLMMERLHAPADQATASITRFEEKIDSGDLSAVKALDRLGLKFTQIRSQMAVDPQAAFETVIGRMSKETNQGVIADEAFALFQDRSGKMLAFIKEYDRLKKQASESPILSDEDKTAIENFNWMLQKLGQLGQIGVGKIVGALSRPGADYGDENYNVPTRRTGDIELKAPPSGPSPLGGPNAPDSGATSAISNLMDKYLAPHELASRQVKEDWNAMLLFERQGLATHAQVLELKYRIESEYREKERAAQKERQSEYNKIEAEYNKVVSSDMRLLGEFDSKKASLSLVARDFAELTKAFRAHRITVDEMTRATDEYFAKLAEGAAGPSVRDVMRLFEAGRASISDIQRAEESQNQQNIMRDAEAAWSRGEMGGRDLTEIRDRYRQFLQDRNPGMNTPTYRPLMPDRTVSSLGTINVIPMDQFSEQMLRRWKQQGLPTA